ncbi:unnamed protein product, partial [Brassica rapa subsp. trilocularis]
RFQSLLRLLPLSLPLQTNTFTVTNILFLINLFSFLLSPYSLYKIARFTKKKILSLEPTELFITSGENELLPTYTVFWKNNYSLIFGTSKNKQLKELREMEEFELHHWWSLRLRIRSLRLLDV